MSTTNISKVSERCCTIPRRHNIGLGVFANVLGPTICFICIKTQEVGNIGGNLGSEVPISLKIEVSDEICKNSRIFPKLKPKISFQFKLNSENPLSSSIAEKMAKSPCAVDNVDVIAVPVRPSWLRRLRGPSVLAGGRQRSRRRPERRPGQSGRA